jgi:hypothetical protein
MLERGISQEVYVNNNSSESNAQIDSDEIDSTIPSQMISEALPIVSEAKEQDSI